MEDHFNWADEKNLGITHFGVDPNQLRRDQIRLDTFHLKCAVTRVLMRELQKFMLDQSYKHIQQFKVKVLSKFWNQFHLFVFANNKPFASFQGNELARFIVNIPGINEFLIATFDESLYLKGLMRALVLWKTMFAFLGKTRIDDCGGVDGYKTMIDSYVSNANELFEIGADSFLSDGTKIGEKESFYMHALKNYIPTMARITLERHRLGIGVFNMQGFERRNKESKNTLRRFSNMKGNIVMNNVKRLWDIFYYETNAY